MQYQPYSPTAANCNILLGVFIGLPAATACIETCCAGTHAQPGINWAIVHGTRRQDEGAAEGVSHGWEGRSDGGISNREGGRGLCRGYGEDVELGWDVGGAREGVVKGMVYLAADRRGSGELLCVRVFAQKYEAWEACLKYKSQLAYCSAVKDETFWIDDLGMPHVRGKIEGSGVHHWL